MRVALGLLCRWSPARILSLKCTTHKLCLLLALISAQRSHTLHLLSLDNMKPKQSSVIYKVGDLLKQRRPGQHDFTLSFKAYTSDRKLCVVHYLRTLIRRTKEVRGQERQLFLSRTKPHGKVSSQTISHNNITFVKFSIISINNIPPQNYILKCLPHFGYSRHKNELKRIQIKNLRTYNSLPTVLSSSSLRLSCDVYPLKIVLQIHNIILVTSSSMMHTCDILYAACT